MSKQPLVSIIIPTYNRAYLLSKTLDSVLAQTFTNWECIIVDDGSADDTEAVVKGYEKQDSRFQYYKCRDTYLPGGNGDRNYGAKKSVGDLLIFLDSDDLLLPNTFEHRVKQLKASHFDMLINPTLVFIKKIGDSNMLWNVIKKESTNEQLLIRFFNTNMSWQNWELHCRTLLHQPNLSCKAVAPDNYYRDMTEFGIASKPERLSYITAVEHAILLVVKALKMSAVSSQVMSAFKHVVYRRFIEYRILNGYKLKPLIFLFHADVFNKLSQWNYFKTYLLFLLGRSAKLKGAF